MYLRDYLKRCTTHGIVQKVTTILQGKSAVKKDLSVIAYSRLYCPCKIVVTFWSIPWHMNTSVVKLKSFLNVMFY